METAPWPTRTPDDDLLIRLENLRIVYPRWRTIRDEIARCHRVRRLVATPAEPPCLMLVGPTGVGKSMLVGSYAQEFPPTVAVGTDGERTLRPIVQATIPTPATVKSLAVALLLAVGDPRATSGTVVTMTDRLTRYLADCRVELLILDELQHFVDRNSQRVLEDASNWLKLLLKTTRVACVLVGLQHEAELLLRANAQLARLFGDPYALDPFTWDETRPESVAEFRRALVEIERLLPLAAPSHLAARALLAGRDHLDADTLAAAFAHRMAGQRRGIVNPFGPDPAAGQTGVGLPSGPYDRWRPATRDLARRRVRAGARRP